jgi:hypothetical protein
MIERVKFGFTLKTGHALGIAGERFGQDFDGYVAAQLGIVGPVDFSHSTGADSTCDFVGAHGGARGQGHLGLDYSLGM